MNYIHQYAQWYCYNCKEYLQPQQQPQPTTPSSNIWYQNFYRIRKKVLTIGNKYWIEDYNGAILGFSKQKLFKLKEDIRIYTDETMSTELFRIQQQQILDIWGTFAVIDSFTNSVLGYVKRKALASTFVRDEWEIYDPNNQLIGGMYESTGRGLARKYLPGGGLIPEKITLELQGRPVAEINQQFKIIGDIWEMNCLNVPRYLDRRVLLSFMLLMGMIERGRK